MAKKYKAVQGSILTDKDAQIYGKCLEDIEAKHGNIKPELVVQEAKDKASPMHSFFDWDDNSAAAKYRKQQARNIIKSITVVVNYATGETQKAFFSVKEGTSSRATLAYVNVERALTETELRKQVLRKAMDEVVYWKNSYKSYKEFSKIVKAVDTTSKRLGLI